MEKSLFESLKASLHEAIDHAEGKVEARTRKITIKPVPTISAAEVKKLRKELAMTQLMFGQLLGVSKKTVEAWEAGTNTPNGSAMRLLQLFVENPALVKEGLFVEEEVEYAGK